MALYEQGMVPLDETVFLQLKGSLLDPWIRPHTCDIKDAYEAHRYSRIFRLR